ncbi:unnamed protein product [Brachionus calyciflorus]|uniref:EF-hand domain-containing protein n=1 Tax=Brachionus calyciflorus TaxID=104777 RepID=A0A813MMG9_9BILA|nr:unnamed protein product [Brachionus calyciflorus]
MLTIFNLKKKLHKKRNNNNQLRLPIIRDEPLTDEYHKWNQEIWPKYYDIDRYQSVNRSLFKIKKSDWIDHYDLLTNLKNFFMLKKEFRDFGCRVDYEIIPGISRSKSLSAINSIKSKNSSRCYYSSIQIYVAQIFRSMDLDYDNRLTCFEFCKGINKLLENNFCYEQNGLYNVNNEYSISNVKNSKANKISIDENLVKRLFNSFDLNGDGFVDYGEFIKGFRLPMCPKRVNVLNEAFNSLDLNTKDKLIDIDDVKKWLRNNSNGKTSNDERITRNALIWISQFNTYNQPNFKIDLENFIEFYQILSSTIMSDAYFDLIIRTSFDI